MSTFGEPKQQVVDSLRAYTSLLKDRNAALGRISGVSERLLSTLAADPTADVSRLIEERESECRQLASVSAAVPTETLDALAGQSDEAGVLARSAAALDGDAQALGDRILACQAQCESIMKTRLESISKAIRESGQRRRLDAAYGPACSHDAPMFLDRQR